MTVPMVPGSLETHPTADPGIRRSSESAAMRRSKALAFFRTPARCAFRAATPLRSLSRSSFQSSAPSGAGAGPGHRLADEISNLDGAGEHAAGEGAEPEALGLDVDGGGTGLAEEGGAGDAEHVGQGNGLEEAEDAHEGRGDDVEVDSEGLRVGDGAGDERVGCGEGAGKVEGAHGAARDVDLGLERVEGQGGEARGGRGAGGEDGVEGWEEEGVGEEYLEDGLDTAEETFESDY
ncbi:predicted protein [Verticillium alfalfae VaMs.102]|uniref:Predicted protein n=1 Tax=Verticillium alfalfae (strain VaMs.102 / ATCC MYA-4576 / FGSC 10136) TaxID=526221 RepID=C9SSK9_VERA1|nr:predicted protein [Verticillium alfalfae VaMs.102]EEY21774.1 predicted protein [Verticillium alfalfae VaMs.102]